jgi:DNA-binding PucR family transcriptional regulator
MKTNIDKPAYRRGRYSTIKSQKVLEILSFDWQKMPVEKLKEIYKNPARIRNPILLLEKKKLIKLRKIGANYSSWAVKKFS